MDKHVQSSSLVPIPQTRGAAKSRHHNFIFQRRGTARWHLILSINLCFTRICYMVEHALASNEILVDIFPNMVYREVFLGDPQNRWLLTTRKGI